MDDFEETLEEFVENYLAGNVKVGSFLWLWTMDRVDFIFPAILYLSIYALDWFLEVVLELIFLSDATHQPFPSQVNKMLATLFFM